MTIRLPRVIQKIFGINADADDAIAQFGSVIAGQPTFTGDIEEIQALNAWNNGWVGSTITNKRYPTSEETTGINKVVTQQLAYLLQRGIPEWSAEETYYTNSFCQVDGTIYVSLTDNNIGNIPTASASAWRLYEVNNSVTRSIGELTISPIPLIEAGLHLLDGALLDGSGIYNEFVDYIAKRYNDDNKTPNVNLIGLIREDDGILSNFSADGYATLPNSVSLGNNFEICVKFTTGSDVTTNAMLIRSNQKIACFGVETDGVFGYNVGDGSTWLVGTNNKGSHTIQANTTYYGKLTYDGSTYKAYISTDNENWEEDWSFVSSNIIPSAVIDIGLNTTSTTSPWLGSIDLNASYINIDNKRWWSGMKTSWTVDENVWQSSIANYGVCGKFVYDPTANTVRLPRITSIIEGTTDLNALGDLIEAGLPAMTTSSAGSHNHSLGAEVWRGADGNTQRVAWCGGDRYIGSATGWTSTTGAHTHTINTGVREASTVQPQTIKLMFYICVATATKTEIQVDIDEIATDLNGKADVDLSNMSASQSVKNEIISWGMPDFSSRITIPYNKSIKLPCDAVVYHSNYSATYTDYCHTAISLDNSTWIDIGYWGYTAMAFSYTVLPKGIYVKCYGGRDTATYTAWYAPLKGTSSNNTSNSGTPDGEITPGSHEDDSGFDAG